MGNFKNTVACLKRLIGRRLEDDEDVMGIEKKYVNCNLVASTEGSDIGEVNAEVKEKKSGEF